MIIRICGIVAAAAALLLAGCGQKAAIDYNGKVVTASGWKGGDDQPLDQVLKVYASTDPGAPPVAGTYERRGSKIVFRPNTPPAPSVTLRASYRQADGELATAIFPGKGAPVVAASTRVTAIYPTAETWPANVPKLYIQFSAPMSQEKASRHIQLIDDKGQVVAEPFVELEQALWNPAGDRLTVLFDPRRPAGAPLAPGRRYTLRIDKAWPDAAGAPLAAGFERSFTAAADGRQPVEPRVWRVNSPARDQALIIDFPRPMDSALARTTITVRKEGVSVPGQVALEAAETRWLFVPDRAWAPGAYVIHVEGVLEDIAGNRVVASGKAGTTASPASVDLSFSVK